MTVGNISLFLQALELYGYKAESNRMAMGHAAHQYWKGVNGPDGKRLYTMEVRMHDRADIEDYDVKRFGRWGVSYRLWVNHTTSADVDRLSVDVMHETMDVEEWERRCAVLWGAMKDGFGAANTARRGAEGAEERGEGAPQAAEGAEECQPTTGTRMEGMNADEHR